MLNWMTDYKFVEKYSSTSFILYLSIHTGHGITSDQTKKYARKI